MGKQTTFAKEEVMEDYLQSLLTGFEEAQPKVTPQPEPEPVLLKEPDVPPLKAPDLRPEPITESIEITPQPVSAVPLVDQLEDTFQALLFEVAGLTLAVPLITLGGIHNFSKTSPLVGKPTWFMGVMLHRDEKFNIVDSAKWVMPEKITKKLEESLNYQYVIMLADTDWGLASDKLVSTVTLSKEDVKWRKSDNRRPWLAGMVKERMCALIDVYQLISILNKGLGRDEALKKGEPTK